MKIFNGRRAADKISADLTKEIKKTKCKLTFAVILVGEDSASKLYIELKKKAAARVGISVKEYFFDGKAAEDQIINKIKELNEDVKINGIIVQLPLPAVYNTDKIVETIDPKKDIDGFSRENRKLLEKNEAWLQPVLPEAIMKAVATALRNKFAGKKILALVNSEIFGKTLKQVFNNAGVQMEYLVRNHCVIFGAEKEIKAADILISVCGCPNFIKADMIKEGAILIDGGVTRFSDGRVVGDFERTSVSQRAAYLTPVPGGIGPVTVALLLKNVYLASKIISDKIKA
jgi:methylenetetrahydrofolate dehydrogenase (NADP+)/methenyltetrahydrofolate cyclohydrolase